MAKYTENYGFTLPAEDDGYDISVYDNNFETVDTLLGETELNVTAVSEKIGNPEDSAETSVFGKLNSLQQTMANGSSLIKSIQRVTYAPPRNVTSGSISIQTVDPTKTFVIFERLHDEIHEYLSKFSYTLNANSISCTFEQNASDVLRLYGFWIIEFY